MPDHAPTDRAPGDHAPTDHPAAGPAPTHHPAADRAPAGKPPSRRADAARNRRRILEAARTAFAAAGSETSMAEIARRSGVGQATLYRNFATRRELLEALLADEVDEVCAAAATVEGDTPGDRLMTWLRRFFQYVTTKRPVVLGLLEHTDRTDPVFQSRGRMLAAGRPLFAAARDAHEIADDLDLDQILDLVVAVAKIPGAPEYRRPILETALTALRTGSGSA
jgi:AcrR family transcriptional regulator